MSNKPIISIIIPVYGVEKHISKCIESIKNQTFTNFEAILINDGTKDNSVAVAEQAIAGDERFIILHKKNGGQGSARNLGLDNARGDYIAFIDSDDWVKPDYLKAMYEQIIAEDADVCMCSAVLVYENGQVIKSVSSDLKSYFSKNDILLTNNTITNFMWDKLFRKNCFDGLRFDKNLKSNEDVHLLFRVLFGKKLTSIEDQLYFYLQRHRSTSKDVGEKFVEDRLEIFNMHKSFLELKKLERKYHKKLEYSYFVTFIYSSALTISLYSNDYLSDIKLLTSKIDKNKFCFKGVFEVAIINKKLGISLLAFKFSPLLFKFMCDLWFRNRDY